MRRTRTLDDDANDREVLLAYLRARPGQLLEEGQLKGATGVNKAIIRKLLRGLAEIDPQQLNKGKIVFLQPASQADPEGSA